MKKGRLIGELLVERDKGRKLTSFPTAVELAEMLVAMTASDQQKAEKNLAARLPMKLTAFRRQRQNK